MLVAFTIVSAAAAAGLGAWAWRLARKERRRSDARVAALVASLGDLEPAPSGSDRKCPETLGSDPIASPRFEPGLDQGRRGLALAGLAGVGLVAIVLVAGLVIGWTTDVGRAAPPVASSDTPPPLELLSLSATRTGADLAVAGLVRNPPTGAPLDRVTALIFFFDATGGFLTSARVPLDRAVLAPGDESPFHITVPAPEQTSRYRVSFRVGERGVLSHVDRRPTHTERGSTPDAPAVRRAGL
jgi:hypothetical protein